MCFKRGKIENEILEMKEYWLKGFVDFNMYKILNCKFVKWKLIMLFWVFFVFCFIYMYICVFNNYKVERVIL